LFDISRKVFVVTGGNGGIGKMISKTLLVNGGRVFIFSRKVYLMKKL